MWGRVGVGQKVTSNDTFGYYTLEPGLTYKISKTLRAFMSDRFRTSFDDGKNYRSNTVYVGANWDFADKNTVGLDFYNKRSESGDIMSDGIEVSYTRSFQ